MGQEYSRSLHCFNYRHDVRDPKNLKVEDVRGAVHAPDKEASLNLVNPGPVPRAGAGQDIQDIWWVAQVGGSEKLHSYCVNCSEKIIFWRIMSFIFICVFQFVMCFMDHRWDQKGYLEWLMVELHHFDLLSNPVPTTLVLKPIPKGLRWTLKSFLSTCPSKRKFRWTARGRTWSRPS